MKKPAHISSGVLIVFAVSAALLCLLMVHLVDQQIDQESYSQFDQRSAACFKEIDNLFSHYRYDLHDVKTFFECSENVSEREFHDFTRMMVTTHAGLEAICWIPHVPAGQREAFVQTAQRSGMETYRLAPGEGGQFTTPVSECDVLLPVYYAEPAERNQSLRGLNFSCHPEWAEVLTQCAESGKPAVRVDQVMFADGSEPCLVLFYPVYQKESQADPEGARHLMGFAAAVIFPQRDLEAMIYSPTAEMSVRLSSFQKDLTQRYLFVDNPTTAAPIRYKRREFAFANQSFLAEAALVEPCLPAGYRLMPWLLFGAGLLLIGLLVLHIFNIQRQNRRTEEIVISRTSELVRQKEMNRELAQKAEAASRAKSEFLAGMSHEIRTPMNAIIGFAEILSEENLSGVQREYIRTIHDSGQTLMTLINDILDLSKIEAGRMDIEWLDCSVQELLDHIDMLLRPQAERKDIDFEIHAEGDLPDVIRMDPTRLRQCLMNLVSNAIKFTECGHVYVQATVDRSDDEPMLRIDVEDTGIGIEAERCEAIFEAFSQADTSIGRLFGGSGLGLSITRQLTHLMGGTLTVESTPGRGSVFTLKLPLKAVGEPVGAQL